MCAVWPVPKGTISLIPTCVPSGILRETMKEGKKTCFGNESHTSRCSFSSGSSQTSHENGSTLLGSTTLGDHFPRLHEPPHTHQHPHTHISPTTHRPPRR